MSKTGERAPYELTWREELGMTDTPQTPLTDRLRDDRDLEKRWRKDSDDRAAELEATLVTRTQERDYLDGENRILAAKVAALTADLAQAKARLAVYEANYVESASQEPR